DLAALGQVARMTPGGNAPAFTRAHDLRCIIMTPVIRDADTRAGLGEHQCDSATDTTRRARHERALADQVNAEHASSRSHPLAAQRFRMRTLGREELADHRL